MVTPARYPGSLALVPMASSDDPRNVGPVPIHCNHCSTDTTRLGPESELWLSELISAFSVSLDLTEGQPAGHAMRSCLIGMRIADKLELPTEQRSALFYARLLKDLGCSSNAAKWKSCMQKRV